jgi:hypothetical protein
MQRPIPQGTGLLLDGLWEIGLVPAKIIAVMADVHAIVADIPAIIKTTLSLSANGYKKTGAYVKCSPMTSYEGGKSSKKLTLNKYFP